MKKTYKSLAFIGIIFIAIIALIDNDAAELIKTHDVTVVHFKYGKDSLYSGYGLEIPEVEYVEVKSAHGKEYKIYTKKNISIPPDKNIKIYEYKRNNSDMRFFSLHKK